MLACSHNVSSTAQVQRIPRYKLLLTEYIKYSAEGCRDAEAASSALAAVSQAATVVNESIRTKVRKLTRREGKGERKVGMGEGGGAGGGERGIVRGTMRKTPFDVAQHSALPGPARSRSRCPGAPPKHARGTDRELSHTYPISISSV